MTRPHAAEMDHTSSPSGLTEIARKFEPLWIAALGVQLIAGGGILLPRLIRLMGRGGAVETVEWAVYMSMLFVFPVAVGIVGWVFPRLLGEGAASVVKRGLVLLVLVEFAVYVVAARGIVPALAATAAAVAGTALLRLSSRYSVSSSPTLALITCCGVAGWMAGGGLIYWASAVRWLASPVSVVVLLATTIIAATALRRWVMMSDPSASAPVRVLDLVPLAALIAFSFRTNPMRSDAIWALVTMLRRSWLILATASPSWASRAREFRAASRSVCIRPSSASARPISSARPGRVSTTPVSSTPGIAASRNTCCHAYFIRIWILNNIRIIHCREAKKYKRML